MNDELKQLQDNINNRFDALEAKVDTRTDTLGQQIAALGQRVGVLHEDVKADFRFGLEALKGTEEQINARVSKESDALKALIQPIADAVRHLSR